MATEQTTPVAPAVKQTQTTLETKEIKEDLSLALAKLKTENAALKVLAEVTIRPYYAQAGGLNVPDYYIVSRAPAYVDMVGVVNIPDMALRAEDVAKRLINCMFSPRKSK
jgi:hypothetical protein